MARAAVFLDRDGVICQNRDDYVKSWEEFVFVSGAAHACASITRAGIPLFVVTNQSAVGRGIIAREELDAINARMVQDLGAAGAAVEEVLVCPHTPEEACSCRKPRPGLLIGAAAAHDIDLSRSWVVGDAASDVKAAALAGCRSVMVRTGRGAAQLRDASVWNGARPAYVAYDLIDATRWLLGRLTEVTTP